MAEKLFVGRFRTPKQYEVARQDFTTEDCEKMLAMANANEGVVSVVSKKNKSDKDYCEIDTFRKNIPEQLGGEQTSNNNQQQHTSTYTPKYKSNNDYKNDYKNDAPPSMPDNNSDVDDGQIPF